MPPLIPPPPGEEHMRSSFTDGSEQGLPAQRGRARSRSFSSDRAQTASAEPPPEAQGPRFARGLLQAETSARPVTPPATPNTRLVPLGTRRGRQPALSPVGASPRRGLALSPAPPPAKGAGRAAPLLPAAPGGSALVPAAPTPPAPRRCLLASGLRCQDAPSPSHGSSDLLRGDRGSGDD